MDRQELTGTLAAKWERQLVPFTDPGDEYPVYCLYLQEGLTGFACIADPAEFGKFEGDHCVLMPLAKWVMLRALALETVTPFRLVAVGQSGKIMVGAWGPPHHGGLKHPVRNTEHGAMLHIPVTNFKELK